MLYIAPEAVHMERAVKEVAPRMKPGRLVRDEGRAAEGTLSKTGAWGDPTLATYEKGRLIVEPMVERLCAEVSNFAKADFAVAPKRHRYL
jgi:creatinine amidohydrolase